MLKSIQRNSLLYKNTNNVWLVYEFLGNNAFSDEDLFELGDFLHQNQVTAEYMVLNYRWVKKYYVSFFQWETWYANNYSNYNWDLFYSRYHSMINLKPWLHKLKIFTWGKLKEVDLKLYNLENKSIWPSNRDKILKELGYEKEKVRNYLLWENFWLFMDNLLISKWNEYKKFLYDKLYIKNLNFDFYSTDQEIFDSTLNFLTWSKFFIFPFYLKWRNSKVWDMSYQELDFNEMMSRFLDPNIMVSTKDTWKDLVGYLYKVSIKPTQNVSIDKPNKKVSYSWVSSMFDFNSVWDNKNMFFEYQHSMFLYTKRPDIQWLIWKFDSDFWTSIELETTAFPRDFNPQYLNHNKFWNAYHVWHLKNIQNVMASLKEYYPPMKDGMNLWKEYFSNNEFKINFFDLAWKDENNNWNLTTSCNTIIYWNTGAWKTFFVENKIWNTNTTDQLIAFDNLDNFSKSYHSMPEWPKKEAINLFEYWSTFPNIIWEVTEENLANKQEILVKVILWTKAHEVSDLNKTILTAQINNYLKTIIWLKFKLTLFIEWVKLLDLTYITLEQKNFIIQKLDWMNATLVSILNNEHFFDEEMAKKQKVIFSYSQLTDSVDTENTYFTLSLLLRLVRWYLSNKSKKSANELKYRYTMVLFDEAHNVIWKNDVLDDDIKTFMKEMRNRKAQMTLLTQNYWDIPPHLRFLVKIFILLDPDNYKEFKDEKASKEIGVESILDRTFYNFRPALENIVSNYRADEEAVKAKKMKEKDRNRFCVFTNMMNESMYILDTK